MVVFENFQTKKKFTRISNERERERQRQRQRQRERESDRRTETETETETESKKSVQQISFCNKTETIQRQTTPPTQKKFV